MRNYYPLNAWSASALAFLWIGGAYTPAGTIPAGILVYVLCLYAVAVRCEAWVVTTTGIVTAVGAIFVEGQPAFTAILIAAVPVLAGVVVRTRRGGQERLAVQERRHEGERALLQERQRIARELHDVVAHHMSVIAIQAEAAPYKTTDPPKELVESFAEIRASALSGLKELRRVLGVLRSETPDTAPQPGLADLDGLLESARNGGVTISSGVSGTPRPLPDGVDLSAYRIVQEALSNAMRRSGSRRRPGRWWWRSATTTARPGPGNRAACSARAAGMASSACANVPPCWGATCRPARPRKASSW